MIHSSFDTKGERSQKSKIGKPMIPQNRAEVLKKLK